MNNSAASVNTVASTISGSPKPFHAPKATGSSGLMRWIIFALIILGIVNAPMLMTTSVGERGMLAVVIGGLLLMLLLKSPRDGVVLTLIYLGLLGGVRRWLIPSLGWAPQDPLVLVQAAVIGGSCLFFLAIRRLPWDTRLSRCVGVLLGIMALEVFNPLQGGISVGIAGVLYMMIPLLWYYAGRRLGTPLIVLYVIRAALILSLLGACYGLYQTWFGFQPSEQLWIQINRIADIRPFAFFTTVAEYGMFLAVGVGILLAAFLKGNRAALLLIPLLFVALFFLSQRGVVIGSLFLGAVLWAVQGRSLRVWIPRGLLALMLGSIGLIWTLQQAQHMTFGAKTQALVEHQTSGLLDPGHSTAPLHAAMVAGGFGSAIEAPLGHGIGATTIAADKFGAGNISTEADWTDSFVAFGIIGGLLYTYIIGLVLLTAMREWVRTRSFISLAVLGILLASMGHWLHGGYYAIAMLSWFLIGSMDKAARESAVSTAPLQRLNLPKRRLDLL